VREAPSALRMANSCRTRADARDDHERYVDTAEQHHEAAKSFKGNEGLCVFPAQPGTAGSSGLDIEAIVREENPR